jgi:hypothetical protein
MEWAVDKSFIFLQIAVSYFQSILDGMLEFFNQLVVWGALCSLSKFKFQILDFVTPVSSNCFSLAIIVRTCQCLACFADRCPCGTCGKSINSKNGLL